jgi:hypothetical protein
MMIPNRLSLGGLHNGEGGRRLEHASSQRFIKQDYTAQSPQHRQECTGTSLGQAPLVDENPLQVREIEGRSSGQNLKAGLALRQCIPA